MDFLLKHHQSWSGTLSAALLYAAEVTVHPSSKYNFFSPKSTVGQVSFTNGTSKIPPSELLLTVLYSTPFNY